MAGSLKTPEWLKRTTCFFSKSNGSFEMEAAKAVSGISAAMVTDRKLENRPVVDKRAALYQAVKHSNKKNKGHRQDV